VKKFFIISSLLIFQLSFAAEEPQVVYRNNIYNCIIHQASKVLVGAGSMTAIYGVLRVNAGSHSIIDYASIAGGSFVCMVSCIGCMRTENRSNCLEEYHINIYNDQRYQNRVFPTDASTTYNSDAHEENL